MYVFEYTIFLWFEDIQSNSTINNCIFNYQFLTDTFNEQTNFSYFFFSKFFVKLDEMVSAWCSVVNLNFAGKNQENNICMRSLFK